MMNKDTQKGFITPIVLALLALVFVAGGALYFNSKPEAESMKKDGDAMMEKESDATMKKEEGVMMEKEGDAMMKKEEGTVMDSGDTMMKKEDGAMMAKYTGTVLAGKSAPLLEFNKADYDAAIASDKLVVLYFYANWCPVCKEETANALYPAFNELTTDKVIGFRVNYKDNETNSDEKALAVQYGIPYQHTKVLVKNGKQILKAPDGWNKARYTTEINKALAQ
ncbi:MAG: thioredoxin family protein [Patescibacteria group bacterium]